MKAYLLYTVEDYAADLNFIKWALNKEKNSDLDLLYERYVHKRDEIDEAVELVRSLESNYSHLDKEEVFDLWKRIKRRNRRAFSHVFFRYSAYAAVVLLVVGVGLFFSYQQGFIINQNRVFFNEEMSGNQQEFSLTLSDGNIVALGSDTARLEYDPNGNRIKVDNQEIQDQGEDPSALHLLTVPYGKRSHITLSDGTRIWVNSGSQLKYPSTFSEEQRIIYLKGEAYFDVARDESKPFVVKTAELNIEVLGTSFNVNSYNESQEVQTVVEEGMVRVARTGFNMFDQSVMLPPSYGLIYDRHTKSLTKQKVNTQYFTSWKEGYLFLNNEPLDEIILKLKRIYNIEIVLSDKLKNLQFTGKLDLKEDVESELDILQAAYPINYFIKNNQIILEP